MSCIEVSACDAGMGTAGQLARYRPQTEFQADGARLAGDQDTGAVRQGGHRAPERQTTARCLRLRGHPAVVPVRILRLRFQLSPRSVSPGMDPGRFVANNQRGGRTLNASFRKARFLN
jgi:hypothetical protein